MFGGLCCLSFQFRAGTITGFLANGKERSQPYLKLLMLEVKQAAAALQWGFLEQQPEGRIHQLPTREDTEIIDCLQFLFSIRSLEQHNKQ